jgi:hypothetical protein
MPAPTAAASSRQVAPTPTATLEARVVSAELRFSKAPASGVWAELKLVVSYPRDLGATSTTMLLPASLLSDYEIRSTEPGLLAPLSNRRDGRYELTFPPPIVDSFNWYRVFLTARTARPAPLVASVAFDGSQLPLRIEGARPRVMYLDREEEPFKVVPRALVAWLPVSPRQVFPVVVLMTAAIALFAAAGSWAVLWSLRREAAAYTNG